MMSDSCTERFQTYERLGASLIMAENGRTGDALVVGDFGFARRLTNKDPVNEVVGVLGEDAYRLERIDLCKGSRWYRSINLHNQVAIDASGMLVKARRTGGGKDDGI